MCIYANFTKPIDCHLKSLIFQQSVHLQTTQTCKSILKPTFRMKMLNSVPKSGHNRMIDSRMGIFKRANEIVIL